MVVVGIVRRMLPLGFFGQRGLVYWCVLNRAALCSCVPRWHRAVAGSKARCRVSQRAFPWKTGPRPEVNNTAYSQKCTGFLPVYKSPILSDVSASLRCVEPLPAPAG